MGHGHDDRERLFRRFYDEHHGAIHRYARRRVGADKAAEVAVDVFVIAWRRFDSIKEPPLPWLYGVARNVIRSMRRTDRQAVSVLADLNTRASSDPSVDDHVVSRQTMIRAFNQLRENDREILRLVAWEGLTPAEGAVVLGCSAKTFSVRLHRARRRLQAAMDRPPTRERVQ